MDRRTTKVPYGTSTPQVSTGTTPAFLMSGKEIKSKLPVESQDKISQWLMRTLGTEKGYAEDKIMRCSCKPHNSWR